MFVRWKRHTARNRVKRYIGGVTREIEGKGDSLNAYLVENTREGARIRQRVICYLGVVHESTAADLNARVLFWHVASEKLDGLNLARSARKAIEAKLSTKIEYVGPRERERYFSAGWQRVNEIL